MAQPEVENAIPQEVALQLCAEIRQQVRGKWYTSAGMRCWGCTTFTRGDPTKMCVSGKPGYRGCNLVNARFDERLARESQA